MRFCRGKNFEGAFGTFFPRRGRKEGVSSLKKDVWRVAVKKKKRSFRKEPSPKGRGGKSNSRVVKRDDSISGRAA